MIWFATDHALYGQVPNLTSKRLLTGLTPWHVAILPPPGHDPGQVYSATAYQYTLMCIKVLFKSFDILIRQKGKYPHYQNDEYNHRDHTSPIATSYRYCRACVALVI